MRLTLISALVAGCFLASPIAVAQISDADIHLLILGDATQDGKTVIAAKGAPVISTTAVSPRAAKLKEELRVGGIGNEIVLAKDSVLFGRFDKTVWTYCGTAALNAESRLTSGATMAVLTAGFSLLLEPFMEDTRVNCMLDADKDGVFDSAWGGAVPAGESALVVWDVGEQNMSAQVGYERVDAKLGPASPVSIVWERGQGSSLKFSLSVGGLTSGTKTVPIPAPGGAPVRVEVAGVKMKLNSFDAKTERVSVEIEEGFRDMYIRQEARRIITTSYYYY